MNYEFTFNYYLLKAFKNRGRSQLSRSLSIKCNQCALYQKVLFLNREVSYFKYIHTKLCYCHNLDLFANVYSCKLCLSRDNNQKIVDKQEEKSPKHCFIITICILIACIGTILLLLIPFLSSTERKTRTINPPINTPIFTGRLTTKATTSVTTTVSRKITTKNQCLSNNLFQPYTVEVGNSKLFGHLVFVY